jgi:hypothetical protein
MEISQKQNELNQAVRSGKYNEIMLAGGAGSAKTIGILNIIDELCSLVSGVRVGVFRLSDRNIEENTLPSYRKLLGFKEKTIPIIDKIARYPNGSEILFRWADITKDRDCDNIKGGEYTWIFFNEANQISQKYISIGKTRVGRWNKFVNSDGEFRIKPIVFMDCNPSDNWVKTDYYDKYVAGTLADNVYFQLSLPDDNPFLEPEYWEMLNSLPEAEYNRFVKGLWEYSDDPNQLIPYEWIKRNLIEEDSKRPDEYMSADIAREGDDKTVFAYGTKSRCSKLEVFEKYNTMQSGEVFVNRLKEKKILENKSTIDVVGVGGGVVDYVRKEGYRVRAFNSGESPNGNVGMLLFKNRRAEVYWKLREAFERDEYAIPNDEELIKELTNLRYFVDNKTIQIESKSEIKKRLGKSPDKADAVAMLKWISNQANTITMGNLNLGTL